jgi:hypothetical protein
LRQLVAIGGSEGDLAKGSGPGAAEEPTPEDGSAGQREPELDDQAAALGAQRSLPYWLTQA